MPAVRSVLKHVTVEVAKGRRKCGRNKKEHVIAKGQAFLRVREDAQGYKNYCAACAPDILEKAQADLDLLFSTLLLAPQTDGA